jgi:hypothetical protein
LSTIVREPNIYEGIIFVPGRVGEEFAVTIPEGRRIRTIAWKTNLERAVAFRNIYLEQRNREQLCADAPNTDPTTETGDHEQQTQP